MKICPNNCEDFKYLSDYLGAIAMYNSNRVAALKFIGKPIVYCPYCKAELQEE